MKGQTSQNLADGFKIAKNQPVEVASWSHRGSTFLFSTSCGSRCNSIDIFRWKPWEKIRKMPLIYHWSHSEFTLTNLLRQALGASCRWASWYQVGLRCGFWVVEKKSHLWFSVHKKTSGFFQKNIFSFFGFQYHPYIWTVGHSGGLNLFGSNILRVWPQAGWSTTPKQKGPNIYPKWWYAGPKWSKKLYTSAMSFQHKHQSSIWILSPSRTHDLGNGIASPAHQLTFN